jgi:uncharacterized protein (DUF4415 family)
MRAELEALEAMPDSEIDTSDIPPVTDWSGAIRGAFFRAIKKPVAMRLNADVLDWFKRQGPGYQTRINEILREHMERHGKVGR